MMHFQRVQQCKNCNRTNKTERQVTAYYVIIEILDVHNYQVTNVSVKI